VLVHAFMGSMRLPTGSPSRRLMSSSFSIALAVGFVTLSNTPSQ
jgi:hypothetical protein